MGRIKPFLPLGAFEALGRTARVIGQTTPVCPKPGASSCSQSLTIGARAGVQAAHKPSLCPRRACVGSVPRISRHLAETRATAGFQRESGLGGDGRLFLVESGSETCSQSITLLLKPAPLLSLSYCCSSAMTCLTWLRRFRNVRRSLGVQETVTNKHPDGGVSRPCFLP